MALVHPFERMKALPVIFRAGTGMTTWLLLVKVTDCEALFVPALTLPKLMRVRICQEFRV